MATDLDDYDEVADERYARLARLQQRTWTAAAPYLLVAVLAWAAAGLTEYQLNDLFQRGQNDSGAVRQVLLQVLSQALLYVGLALFVVGLLVAALRQHERWRRDCGRWLGDDPGDDDGQPFARTVSTPSTDDPGVAGNTWDHPDELGR